MATENQSVRGSKAAGDPVAGAFLLDLPPPRPVPLNLPVAASPPAWTSSTARPTTAPSLGPTVAPIPVPKVVAAPAPAPTLGAWRSMVRQTRPIEWASLIGKLVGAGLFATLVYTYCNVLIEACIRGIH
jgi:hypothetical protein